MNQTTNLPLVGAATSLRETMAVIDQTAKGIAVVVDDERRLCGTVTDGDLRRAILEGVSLEILVSELLRRKAGRQPITAPAGIEPTALLRLMREHGVRQIPILDGDRRVIDLVTSEDLLPDRFLPLQAVVMAGGFGTRLSPLTEELPKPMLPIDGRPLLELIIRQLRETGVQRVSITTHYRSAKISEYFGDGRAFGVELTYINEKEPLGTAGALALLDSSEEPLLVINGDILTEVNFRAMLTYHQEQRADMTVAVRRYDVDVPYGVVECEGSRVRRVTEKPQVAFFINAGIYLLEPSVCRYVPKGEAFDMTNLVERLLEVDRPVMSFPIREYWLDIGRHGDYELAQEHAKKTAGRS